MYTSKERSTTGPAAGMLAPQMPVTATTTAERPRRYDPAAERCGAHYPVPHFPGYRAEASSRSLS